MTEIQGWNTYLIPMPATFLPTVFQWLHAILCARHLRKFAFDMNDSEHSDRTVCQDNATGQDSLTRHTTVNCTSLKVRDVWDKKLAHRLTKRNSEISDLWCNNSLKQLILNIRKCVTLGIKFGTTSHQMNLRDRYSWPLAQQQFNNIFYFKLLVWTDFWTSEPHKRWHNYMEHPQYI